MRQNPYDSPRAPLSNVRKGKKHRPFVGYLLAPVVGAVILVHVTFYLQVWDDTGLLATVIGASVGVIIYHLIFYRTERTQ
jgi:hypothetical protein